MRRLFRSRLFLSAVALIAIHGRVLPGSRADEIAVAQIEHPADVDFQGELLPILRKKCLACHNATDAESSLVLETPATLLKGGNEGAAVVPGKPDESLAFLLAAQRQEPVMPPEGNSAGAAPFTPEELALFKLWIEQGAKGEVTAGAQAITWKELPAGLNPVLAAAQSSDGRYLAAGRGNQVWVYDLRLGRYVDQLIDPALSDLPAAHGRGIADLDLVQSLSFSPNGEWLASGGYRTAKLWQRTADFSPAYTISPDPLQPISLQGTQLLVANAQGELRVLDAATGQVLQMVATEGGALTTAALSPDGRRLATVHNGNQLRFSILGQVASAPVITASSLQTLVWLDESQLAGAGADAKVYVWAVSADRTVGEPRVLAGHAQPIVALAPTSAGHLISGGADGDVRLWDLASGQTERQFNHGAALAGVRIAGQATRLVTLGTDTPAKLWNLADGVLVAELNQNAALKWRADDKGLAQQVAKRHVDNANQDLEAAKKRATDEEASLAKTKEASDKAQQELTPAKEAAEKAAAEAQKAAAALKDAQEKLAAAEAALAATTAEDAKPAAQQAVDQAKQAVQTAENELKPKQEAQQATAKAQTEKQQAAESALRSVETSTKALGDAKSEVARLEPQVVAMQTALTTAEGEATTATAEQTAFRYLATHACGDAHLITSDQQGNVLIWNAQDGQLVDQRQAVGPPLVALVSLGPDTFLTVGTDGTVSRGELSRHWQLARTIGSPDDQSSLEDRVTALSFSPDGQRLAVGGGQPSRSGELEIYQVSSGELVREFHDAHSDTVFGLAFSPDGKLLASCGADRFMKIFDTETATHVRTFEGHTHHVLTVSWRADGRVLATGGADKVVKLWNFADGSQIRTIQGFGKEVTSLQFAGATDALFAACGDQNLYRCDMGGDRKSVGQGTDFLYVVSLDRLGKSIAFGGHDSVVRAVDVDGKSIVELAPVP